MRSEAFIHRFGAFELHTGSRHLSCGGERVPLPERYRDVLMVLVVRAGKVVSKDELVEAAWNHTAVTDNSIVQAVKALRKTLGAQPDGTPYIETLYGEGYRFNATVETAPAAAPADARQSGGTDVATLLDPYRAFVQGRAALETLDRKAIDLAHQAFADALRIQPAFPQAHIGLANACLLSFEATRADLAPDRASLERADHHAREGCRLDSQVGDAWSTLAMVRHRLGDGPEAIAAARKAVALESQEWRHYLRLAFVSWGDERLLAANRTLAICPGLAFAHWLAATVFVAREAYGAALDHIRAGCAAQDAQRKAGRFAAVGLHWLHGLVLAATGSVDAALDELRRELALEQPGHIYARECAASTWYAIGALLLRKRQPDEAHAAFEEALARVPGYALAAVGRAATSKKSPPDPIPPFSSESTDIFSVVMVRSALLALAGRHAHAAGVCAEALDLAEPGMPGMNAWLLPVEPLLNTSAHREEWAPTLALLRDRAF